MPNQQVFQVTPIEQGDSEVDICQDLKSMQTEIDALLCECDKKHTELLNKLSLKNTTDPFLNAFIAGRMMNVALSKFFKTKELQCLMNQSHGMDSKDAVSLFALRESLSHYKERAAYDNVHPIADIIEMLSQNIAPTLNEMVPSTRPLFKAALATYSFFNSTQQSVNQENHQLTP